MFCTIFMKSFLRSWFVEPLKMIFSAKTALVPVLVQQSGYGHWSEPAPTRVPHSLFLNCSLIDTFFGSRLILFKGCLSALERKLLSLREEGNTTVEKLTPSQEVDDSRWDGTTASSSNNGSSWRPHLLRENRIATDRRYHRRRMLASFYQN